MADPRPMLLQQFVLVVNRLYESPRYATGLEETARCLVAMRDDRACVVMADTSRSGISITNAAAQLVAFIQRLHIGCKGIGWDSVCWVYRDSEGSWDEIRIAAWDGESDPVVDFHPVGNRTKADAIRFLVDHGFVINAAEWERLCRHV